MAKKKKKVLASASAPVTGSAGSGRSGWFVMDWLAAASVFLAGIVAYCNSLGGVFIMDDTYAILDDPVIRSLWPPWTVMYSPNNAPRPVVGLSLAFNYAVSGLDPWSYHVFNIAVHSLAALTLFALLRFILPRIVPAWSAPEFDPPARVLAWAAALLWAVHPLHTQAVDYVIQRCESLMGLLFLVSFYCAVRALEQEQPKRNVWLWQIGATCACMASIGCKQVAAAAPILALLYGRTFVYGSFVQTLRNRPFLFAGMFASYALVPLDLALARKIETVGAGVSAWEYFRSQPGVICHYLRLAVWPAGLCFDYLWPVATHWTEIVPYALPLLGLAAATFWAVVLSKNPSARAWGFLGAWFFVILAPSSSFLPIHDLAFEYRMYLPLAAVLLAFVVGLRRLCGQSKWHLKLSGVVFVLALVLCSLTLERNEVYRSKSAIWQDTATKHPENPRALDSWGLGLIDEGRYEDAVPVLRDFVRSQPELAKAHIDLGCALDLAERRRGLLNGVADGEVEREYREGLRLEPHHEKALFNLASRYQDRGDLAQAQPLYDELLKYHPDWFEGLYNLGSLYYSQKRYAESIAVLSKALELRPTASVAWGNRAAAYIELNQLAEARADLLQAVRFDPQNPIAHFNLGRVYVLQGQRGEALGALENALRIKPDYPQAQRLIEALRGSTAP